jgi:hypothetical protein
MRRFLPKLVVFFLFLVSCSLFLTPAYAVSQATPTPTTQANPKNAALISNTNADVPNNLHNWTQTVMIETMSALTCQIAGIDPINPKQPCLGADQKTGKIGFLPSPQTGGAIGFMGNMISVLYTPPLHTSDYFQYLASNFGIDKKAYAQTGTGFDSLKPLMNIWVAFRNIVYLILVIIFVAIGLAIMLRVKIDPRTVMTIQNQIPKIIVGILAVTFSFAIAGFLIDIMWVMIYLIYNVITQAAGSGYEVIKAAGLEGGTPFGVIGANNSWSILWEAAFGIGKTIVNMLGLDSVIHNGTNSTGFWPGLGYGFATVFLGIVSGLLGIIGGLIAYIIIAVALLVALFKIWLSLIKAYAFILLDVVIAPFYIIGGVIPGSPISIGGWLKDIGANLLAFPVTIAMFMFAIVFKDIFGKATTGQYFFPPLVGNSADMPPSLVGAFISLGIILITPNVTNMLKQMLKAPKTNFGAGIGSGTAVIGGTFKQGMSSIAASKYNAMTGEAFKDNKGRFGRIFTSLVK